MVVSALEKVVKLLIATSGPDAGLQINLAISSQPSYLALPRATSLSTSSSDCLATSDADLAAAAGFLRAVSTSETEAHPPETRSRIPTEIGPSRIRYSPDIVLRDIGAAHDWPRQAIDAAHPMVVLASPCGQRNSS